MKSEIMISRIANAVIPPDLKYIIHVDEFERLRVIDDVPRYLFSQHTVSGC